MKATSFTKTTRPSLKAIKAKRALVASLRTRLGTCNMRDYKAVEAAFNTEHDNLVEMETGVRPVRGVL